MGALAAHGVPLSEIPTRSNSTTVEEFLKGWDEDLTRGPGWAVAEVLSKLPATLLRAPVRSDRLRDFVTEAQKSIEANYLVWDAERP